MNQRRLMISIAGGYQSSCRIILHTEEELPAELVEKLQAEIGQEVVVVVGTLPIKTPMMEELKYLPHELSLKTFEESKHGPRAVEPVALGKLFGASSNRGGDYAVRPSGTSRFVRPPNYSTKVSGSSRAKMPRGWRAKRKKLAKISNASKKRNRAA